MAKKKAKRTQEDLVSIPKHVRFELLSIFLFLLSLFIYISNTSPKTTGFIGHWVISIGAKHIVGQSIHYLPIFLCLAGLTLLLPFSKKKPALITLIICYINFTIYLELIINKIVPKFQFPAPLNGGGYIGHYGLFVLQQVIGYHGTWILLIGVLLTTIILVFNFSFIHAGKFLFTNLFSEKNKNESGAKIPFLTLLKYTLFYERKPLKLAYETAKTTVVEKETKPKEPKFKLPDFNEEKI